MERRRFTREFKVEAVKLVRERGVAVVGRSLAPIGPATVVPALSLLGDERTSLEPDPRSEFDPLRKSPLPMNLRCHVAKYWGRKTHIALNRCAVGSMPRMIACAISVLPLALLL
jgi:hypothetical protein